MMRKITTILTILLLATSSASSQEYSQLIFRNDSIFGFNNTTKAFEFIHKKMPSMVGQTGKVIGTNGTSYIWTEAGGVHTHVIGEVTGLQAAIDTKAPIASPTFTGTVSGITKAMVGLANVDNTSDANKPISTATQTALNAKASLTGSEVLTGKTLGMFNYGSDAGANDSYVISLTPAPAAYATGMLIVMRANTINTGAASVNVNGLGAKTIVKRVNTALANGDILAGMFCLLIYDGTNFVIVNPVVN